VHVTCASTTFVELKTCDKLRRGVWLLTPSEVSTWTRWTSLFSDSKDSIHGWITPTCSLPKCQCQRLQHKTNWEVLNAETVLCINHSFQRFFFCIILLLLASRMFLSETLKSWASDGGKPSSQWIRKGGGRVFSWYFVFKQTETVLKIQLLM